MDSPTPITMDAIYQRLHRVPHTIDNATIGGVFLRTGIGDIPTEYQPYTLLPLRDALSEIQEFARRKKGLREGYDRADVYTLLALSINRYVNESGIHVKYPEYVSLPDALDGMLTLSNELWSQMKPYKVGVDGETKQEYSTAHLMHLIKVELTSNPNLNEKTITNLLKFNANPENNIGWNPALNKHHLHNYFVTQVMPDIHRHEFMRYGVLQNLLGKFNGVDGDLIAEWLDILMCQKASLSTFWHIFEGMAMNNFTHQESFEGIIPLIHQNIGFAVDRKHVCLDLINHPNFPKKHGTDLREKLFQETKDITFLQSEAQGLFIF